MRFSIWIIASIIAVGASATARCATIRTNMVDVINANDDAYIRIHHGSGTHTSVFSRDPYLTLPYDLALGLQTIDVVIHWYRVHEGDAFTKSGIQGDQYQEIAGGVPVSIDEEPFFLGFYIPVLEDIVDDDHLGWLKLSATPALSTNLNLVAQATGIDAPGIIVGEATLVPEPSVFVMSSLALVAVIAGRRRLLRSPSGV